jgi:hypothetical protein
MLRTLSWTGLFGVMTLVGVVLVVSAQLDSSSNVALADASFNITQTNGNNIGDYECNADEWHWIINQLDTRAKPDHIHVQLDGVNIQVNLDANPSVNAHYTYTGHLDGMATALATALLENSETWTGQFNLSHGPCNTSTATPTETNTPVTPTETNTPGGPTETNTPEDPTVTNTPVEPTETNTPVEPTETNTPGGPTETNTPEDPTATNTPVEPTETNTPVSPTETNTPVPPTPTSTNTPGAGVASTSTPIPSATPTFTPLSQAQGVVVTPTPTQAPVSEVEQVRSLPTTGSGGDWPATRSIGIGLIVVGLLGMLAATAILRPRVNR